MYKPEGCILQFYADCAHKFGMHSHKKTNIQNAKLNVDPKCSSNDNKKGSKNKKDHIDALMAKIQQQVEAVGAVKKGNCRFTITD